MKWKGWLASATLRDELEQLAGEHTRVFGPRRNDTAMASRVAGPCPGSKATRSMSPLWTSCCCASRAGVRARDFVYVFCMRANWIRVCYCGREMLTLWF